ncbi:NADPH-dependent F420 reductase [Intrasporangium calvum]|uniref:NADP oxidoreductase coenzyme F420-dependent n=1 Tax=Intrasporangium calvum (strain ATCC 23552 / DSM 43043 / JCM 3097 / NBRC 12989 / NCIMB 10167 / NRRL B-3866 / 7 KIP) TaxID=710696 RepID=E6S6U2_INTC7|nr:NAD(P)-binding domain-containing protein [Intrasporangium calvum]ADU46828.1 NADP oxidoreductase coenzyme F420-dependent [Intrasporangium calvum DSM 43043]
MHVAIIGSGNVGGALAGAAIAAGHSVTLSAADAAHAAEVAGRTGATAAATNAEAVRDADVVVLAIPGLAVPAVADELRDALQGKVVIDATNPLNESFTDTFTTDRSAAEELQERVPGVPVIKAFNTIFASRHGNPSEGGQPLDAYIAGDDAAAKAKAAELAGSLGYRVIDAGSLRMARALEEMAFLNISLNAGNGWTWQSGWKLVGPTEAQ